MKDEIDLIKEHGIGAFLMALPVSMLMFGLALEVISGFPGQNADNMGKYWRNILIASACSFALGFLLRRKGK